ncbi:hypothetical protein RX327_05490 [Bradyrhizobium sp. BEA-2-5]|uniref:hypothetical protein n=1 Tax=Bradyrhizobium TaxID=374 RepID=UPI00128FBC7B|nr:MULTISPECIES: hypothetical protein [Bradyrhizobium]WOH82630.1 hypothetical protein RX327_05490 [Bradyrhizobium sp. BEA-2-5]
MTAIRVPVLFREIGGFRGILAEIAAAADVRRRLFGRGNQLPKGAQRRRQTARVAWGIISDW